MSQTVLEAMPGTYRDFRLFVGGMARLFMQRNLFPAAHPSVGRALEKMVEALSALTQGSRRLKIRNSGRSLHYLNFEFDTAEGKENELHFLRKAFEVLSIGEIEFDPAVEGDELLALAEIAAAAVHRDRSFDISAAWMRINGIKIKHAAQHGGAGTLPATTSERSLGAEQKRRGPVRGAENGLEAILAGVLRNLERIGSREGKNAGRAVLEMIEQEGNNNTIVLLLKSIKEYDEYTFDHSVNVAVISTAIAARLGYCQTEAGAVSMAALMHDMGKIYVPREIIHKTTQLSPREWQYVKRHPIDGERILREEGADDLTRRVAYEHHMRYDLRGYPLPKKGEKCLEASHIVRIADSYDALTTKRSYRRQINPLQAVRLMEKGRGQEFHPGYFDLFMQVLGNIPIGSVLVFEGGERALVIEVGEGGRLPRVRLLTDAAGNEIEKETVLDLAQVDTETAEPRYRLVAIEEDPVRDVNVGAYLVSGRRW